MIKPILSALLLLPLLATPAFAGEGMPAFRPNDVIVFQGDSITDGGRARGSSDHNHTMGQDYAYMIAGQIGAQFPERHLTFENRGIGSEKLSDIAARWQADVINLKPTIVSILIGINDAGAHTPLPEFENTYDKLLADTVAALPKVRLVLCEPFTLPVGRYKDVYAAWEADVNARGLIVSKLAAKYRAADVRLQPILEQLSQKTPPEYWLWDGIHPDYHGHYLLAQEWIRAVNAYYHSPFSR